MRLIRTVCLLYWAFLTVLLSVPEPEKLLGLKHLPETPDDRGPHFVAFVVLGLLVAASRWAIRPVWLVAILTGYATATEVAQCMVPDRFVQIKDLAENLLGLALGAAIYRLVQMRRRGK